MSSELKTLEQTYYELSSLYKNPTKSRKESLNGKASSNHNAELAAMHERLLPQFKENEACQAGGGEKSAVYFKVLATLYEIDDYRGLPPSVGDLIQKEWKAIHLDMTKQSGTSERRGESPSRMKDDFNDPEVRSLWKAKVLCGVAAVEIARKSRRLDTLVAELNDLEAFVELSLHRPDDGRPSWTMLAFVRAAQTRLARQNQEYDYVQERLLSVAQCLDERAAEIIEKLDKLGRPGNKTSEQEAEIEGLTDDLVFIRQKQTLSSLFNVGLVNLQRGFLRTAEYACQSAQFQFRLHGHFFHRLYNELVMISIKRAQMYTDDKEDLRALKKELELNILPKLKPEGSTGNLKLYLYGLREMTVIQSACGETGEMLDTLNTMRRIEHLGPHWISRINMLHARYCYRHWKQSPEGERDDGLLQEALTYSEAAFEDATDLREGIRGYGDAQRLLARIKGSASKSLIDAIESLVTYGTAQLLLNNPSEAIKSAGAVVELSISDNPRLLAMGYLVLAEAYFQKGLKMEAREYLTIAKTLESQIDHKYVEERRRAVEALMPECLDLKGVKKLEDAEDLLMGWFIENRTRKSSVLKIAEDVRRDPKTIRSFLRRLRNPENRSSPFRHLAKILGKKKQRKKADANRRMPPQ
jgi:hypothetical protein